MLRRADILKVIVQCLLCNTDYTKSDSRIYSHYNIGEALRNQILIKN